MLGFVYLKSYARSDTVRVMCTQKGSSKHTFSAELGTVYIVLYIKSLYLPLGSSRPILFAPSDSVSSAKFFQITFQPRSFLNRDARD